MRRRVITNREAFSRLHPRSRTHRFPLLAILGLILAGIAGAVVVGYICYRSYRYREQNWESAVATIEEIRKKPVTQVNSIYGGAVLYKVEVLAKFDVHGMSREQWIAVEQSPENLAEAEFQARRWTGHQCFVRWNPANPSQILAEIH